MDTEFSSDEEDDVLESITSNSDISLRETDQEVLRLLFYLAERCTSNQSYVHHGVACNCCGRSPIFGARFHCTEGCPDVDICYGCEASYRHSKFHTLIKIRIAIPLNFSPRISIDSRIPSTINSSIPKELPEHVVVMLTSELRVYRQYVYKMYEKFCVMADVYEVHTKNGGHTHGISKGRLLDFIVPPIKHETLATACFRFYDKDRDGLVTFSEFIRRAHLLSEENTEAYFKAAIEGYDNNLDGYITISNIEDLLGSYYSHRIKQLTRSSNSFQAADNPRAFELQRPISSAFSVNSADIGRPAINPSADQINPMRAIDRDIYDGLTNSTHNSSTVSLDLKGLLLGTRNAEIVDSLVSEIMGLLGVVIFKNRTEMSVSEFTQVFVRGAENKRNLGDHNTRDFEILASYLNLCRI